MARGSGTNRRPAGRRTETGAGSDAVSDSTGRPRDGGDRAARPTDEAAAAGPAPGTSADETREALDARDRRQSATRKAAGPAHDRVGADDVVVEPSEAPPGPGPTDPR